MDIPAVLDALGYSGSCWGVCANSGNTYAELAAYWPTSECGPVPEESVMLAKWAEIEADFARIDIRAERDRRLVATDYIVLRQYEQSTLSTEDFNAWKAYRQELRDFPETVDLQNIVWPTPPA